MAYATSLLLPALSADGESYLGALVLAMGWMVIGDEFRWVANIFYGVALVALGVTRTSPNFFAVAPAMVAAILAWSCVLIPPLAAVGGSSNPRMSSAILEAGAWAWMFALGLFAWATFLPRQPVKEIRELPDPRPVTPESPLTSESPQSEGRLLMAESPGYRTFSESVKICISKFADFSGRASRSEYWWWVLFSVPVYFVLSIVKYSLSAESSLDAQGNGSIDVLFVLVGLALTVPSLAVGSRRLHDTGRSGWLQLLWLVPVVGPLLVLYFLVQESQSPIPSPSESEKNRSGEKQLSD